MFCFSLQISRKGFEIDNFLQSRSPCRGSSTLCHRQPSQPQPILRSLLKLSPWVYLCVSLWGVCRTLKKSCIKEIFMASIFSSVFFVSFLFSLLLSSSLSSVLDSHLLCKQGYSTTQTQSFTHYGCHSGFGNCNSPASASRVMLFQIYSLMPRLRFLVFNIHH